MSLQDHSLPVAADDGSFVDGGCLLRPATPKDDAELSQLFHTVFRPVCENRRVRGSWLWRYRSAAATAETQSCVAVELDSGRILAHAGGRSHRTLWCGRRRRSIECIDDMVAPHARRGLSRHRVFLGLKRFLAQRYCGPSGNTFGWGFPNAPAFRIGRHGAGYQHTLDVTLLVCRQGHRLQGKGTRVQVRRVAAVSSDVDELFERCAPDLGIAVVRDQAHLTQRYCRCPEQTYAILEARDRTGDTLLGIAVLRSGGIAPDVAMLMDWLVPRDDRETTTALLAAAADRVRAQGLAALVAWFPGDKGYFREFADRGFEPTPSKMFLAGRSWDPEFPVHAIARQLYMTFGDMDSY